ncbi:PspA/IM30 family protein [Chitinasiproducens palmae]|uniref:Phage shock protein A (PspA) family protein n=1 Tax=Chitinasiproducens palmae TaxID=1770053 RepID=A0A1H2PSH5_9BURK|nr:PspA/IM30 family protein [Chitinasiproducens palmae]SDV49922.1 phage shock protein A (PspA) family protein [Chitinasiproducens palmae]
MSLFANISRTIKGLLNDAADSVQDPSRDARQIIRELDSSIGRAENSLIEIQAQVANQRSKRDAADEKARKYAEGAMRALKNGDETLAREALAAQAAAEGERDQLAAEFAKVEPSVANLREQIANMRKRRDDLKSRSNVLAAKQEIASAKEVAATALGGIGGQNFNEDFSRLEEKVNMANARSDARLETADDLSGKTLDDKLAAMEHGPTVDERLAALKAQIGKDGQPSA